MADIPGTPTGPATWDVTALRRTAWDAKARVDMVRPSIFTSLKAAFKMAQEQIVINRPGIMLDVSNVGKQQSGQSVRVALRMPLSGIPYYGSDTPLNNEDETELYYAEMFYNDIRKAVKMYTYGYEFNDTEYLNLNEGYNAQLSDYLSELFDLRCQQALLLTYDDAICGTGIAKTRQFNNNWWIPNYTSDAPDYDSTDQTRTAGAADTKGYYSAAVYSGATSMIENIGDALASAAGVGATGTAILDSDTMAEMVNWIQDQHIVDPLMIDGQPKVVMKIPVRVKSYLMNPNLSGSLGSAFQSVAHYGKMDRDLLPGEFGTIYDYVVLCTDPRCATLVLSGSDGAWGLKPGYIYPGNWDMRNNSAWSNTSGDTNYAFDVCTVMGANALGRYLKTNVRSGLMEQTDYEKIKGLCSYMGDGVQIPFFDKGTHGDTTRISRGSCVVPVSRVAVWS